MYLSLEGAGALTRVKKEPQVCFSVWWRKCSSVSTKSLKYFSYVAFNISTILYFPRIQHLLVKTPCFCPPVNCSHYPQQTDPDFPPLKLSQIPAFREREA